MTLADSGRHILDRGRAEARIALCDRGQVVPLPGATHWVQHEDPDEENRRPIDFLAGDCRAVGLNDTDHGQL